MTKITVDDLMTAVKQYEDPYKDLHWRDRPDLTDFQRETLEEMEAENARIREEEEKKHREWEIDRVYNRFLNGNQRKAEILMDKHEYWGKKEADCQMCGLEATKVPTSYYGKTVEVPSMRVWRIDSNGPFSNENTLSLCHNCGTKGKGKNLMLWVYEQLSEPQREHVKQICKDGNPELGKEKALEYYRGARTQKEEGGNWFEGL